MAFYNVCRLFKINKLSFFSNKNRWKTKNTPFWNSKRLMSSTNIIDITVPFSDGKKLNLSSGNYATIADGCAVAKMGDSSVMVTAVSAKTPSSSFFVPLSVDYRQKAAAAGRIPTNFFRRELGHSEQEILTSRLIDRSLRPLFPTEYYYDTQIVCNMLALDGINDPDILSINAASAALSLSDIPWNGPVGAVRVGMIDHEILFNPTRREMQQSVLNLIVTATKQNLVIMLEGSADNITEPELKKAIKGGAKECQSIVNSINSIQQKHGKSKRELPPSDEKYQKVLESARSLSETRIKKVFTNYQLDKASRDVAIQHLRTTVLEELKKDETITPNLIDKAFNEVCKTTFRDLIFEKNQRCDGRGLQEVRKITCKTSLFSPLHGSSLFRRGQTQVLCTVTLDSLDSALKMDTISMLVSGTKAKNFFLHYEFPPYATNEIKLTSSVKRREIGHGALAERGLRSVVPKDYPFTIRLTSEVLESNGSSSMASVCGGSLALLDAGVPITAPAAGVAIGLVTKYKMGDTKNIEDYRILTDILGIEDYLGDMDFKLAGTKKGITALQADIKIPGLPLKIVMDSIKEALTAKFNIIQTMNACISKPKTDKESVMPVTEDLEIQCHQRGKFLGVGGINLKKIFLETGVNVSHRDENTYNLFAPNITAMNEAKEMIEKLLETDREPTLEFGSIYTAKVVEVREIGVLVTLYPNMVPALLSNSQLDQRKIHHPSALGIEVGQEVRVKYFGRDPVSGHMRLSRKVLQEPVHTMKNLSSTT